MSGEIRWNFLEVSKSPKSRRVVKLKNIEKGSTFGGLFMNI